MQIPPNQQVRVVFLELVQEAIGNDGQLGYVEISQIRTVLKEVIDSELADGFAHNQFDVLQVWHGFSDHRY